MTLVDMGMLDEEELKYMIVDKDTGDVYDMRDEEDMEFLSNQTTTLTATGAIQPNWKHWWQQKKRVN